MDELGVSPERKIVVNRCFGGFGLSHEAILRYAELKGIRLYPEKDGSFSWYRYWTDEAHTDSIYDGDIPRDDPALVQAVEEMGEAANGPHAQLDVASIPADVKWEIDEYDGQEHVAEEHRTW